MAGDTHYEVLGIAPGADASSIRRAYVAKARMFHPDFHADASPEVRAHAEEQMRAINDAWAVLGSTGARSKYDRDLRNTGRMYQTASASSSQPSAPVTPERTSGSAPPRWLTMLPMFCLMMAVGCFAVGMVTGIPALLAGAIGSALLGGVMFVVVPVVALKRSKDGSSSPTGRTARA